MQKSYKYAAGLAAITTLCLGIGLAASTHDSTAKKEEAERTVTTAPGVQPPGTEGMRVYRDPATGRFVRPPAAARGLSQELRNMLSRSTEGLTPRVLPNGAIALDLQAGS